MYLRKQGARFRLRERERERIRVEESVCLYSVVFAIRLRLLLDLQDE